MGTILICGCFGCVCMVGDRIYIQTIHEVMVSVNELGVSNVTCLWNGTNHQTSPPRSAVSRYNIHQDCDVDYQHWSLAQQVTMMMWCTQLTLMNGTEEDEDSTA